MNIILATPPPSAVAGITAALASWQADDGVDHHIHPGDLGWFARFGAAKTATSLRTWSAASDGTLLAVGLLDGADLLRATTAPAARSDETLARAMAADITDPARGVLPAGPVAFDIAGDALVRAYVADTPGWADADEWTWLRADVGDGTSPPPLPSNVRIEIVKSAEQIRQRADMQILAFRNSSFTVSRWHDMAASPAYAEISARCLLLYEDGEAVGAATVWSAGPGRPGLLEPVGVSVVRQGCGLGTVLCRAAVEELRRMGASSAVVATTSDNGPAVAAYQKAGFSVTKLHRDLCRGE